MSVLKSNQCKVGQRTPVTWNPSELDANCTLSNGNRTVASTLNGDRGTSAWFARTVGKWYYEVLIGASWTGADTGFGPLKQGASKATMGSNGGNGLVIYASGTVWNGASQGAGGFVTAANTVYGCAIDLGTKGGWFTNGTIWTFSGVPSTGTNAKTGGWTLGDKVCPAVVLGANLGSITLRTRASDFTLATALPTGFLPWEP